MTFEQIQSATLSLSPSERLRLIQKLLDSLTLPVQQTERENDVENPLQDWVGIFAGHSGDVSERASELLLEAADPVGGFGSH